MKLIGLLIALLISFSALSFPLGIKGQNQSVPQYPVNIQVPNNQLTTLAGGDVLVEGGSKNLLANPGFEHSSYDNSWTVTAGATYSAETSAPLSGKKSFKAVASSQIIEVKQHSTLYASTLAGSQMFLRVVATNTAPGVKVCVIKNSVTLSGSNDCVTMATDGVRRTYEIGFIADGTNNGISIAAPSTTGTLVIDDAEVSPDSPNFIDVAQIGPWISYTPTFTGFGTPTSVSFRYRVNGSSLDIEGRFTSGTTTAVEARISIPEGFTTVTRSLGAIVGRGVRSAGASAYAKDYSIIDGGNLTYLTMARIEETGGTDPATSAAASSIIVSGQVMHVLASIPVQGLSNKITTYSQQCVKDVDCENVFSAKVSATGVVSGENLDWIDGNCTGTSPYTCTFNAGIFTQTPNCTIAPGPTLTAVTARIDSHSSSNVVVRIFTVSGSPASANDNFIIQCTKQGADFKAKNVITGSFQNIEKCADPYECTNVYSAKVSDSDVVSAENVDWINGNCTNATTGKQTCSFNAGIFTVAPNCTVSADNNTIAGRICQIEAVSSSSVTTLCATDSGSASNMATTIICQKQGADFKPKTAVAGTYLDAVTSPGAGRPITFGASISAAGVITNNDGGIITSASCSVGNFTVNISGLSSAPRRCFIQNTNSVADTYQAYNVVKGTSTITFTTRSAGAGVTCYPVDLQCWTNQ
jgi:hypothetical protein